MADEGLIRCCCRLSPGWAGRTGSVRMRCHTSQRGFLPLTETERSPKALSTVFNALAIHHVPDVVSRLVFLASSFSFSSADSFVRILRHKSPHRGAGGAREKLLQFIENKW